MRSKYPLTILQIVGAEVAIRTLVEGKGSNV